MIRVYCAVLFIVDKLAEILNLLVIVSIFIELVSHCVYFVKAMNKFFFLQTMLLKALYASQILVYVSKS